MHQGYKILFGGVMWMALAAGFLRPLAPDVHWERLGVLEISCQSDRILYSKGQTDERRI